ncbi:hypothetical protein PR048_013868 [Dryococelus australis]|uniref:Uncharacterized protein n=1 Tax=Dryococelus australis TaxID=614101 RepID=A0ABQ9HU73_9NEOP|nr:hypothetical protein PR048_013868 [Dryococelus australis]
MNTAGNFMHSMFVFPRKKENLKLLDYTPPVSFAVYHQSGWIQKEAVGLVTLARENHIVILCFSPHCTQCLQPLDVSFIAPLIEYFEQGVWKWLFAHPG